jgi:hypothetical protein
MDLQPNPARTLTHVFALALGIIWCAFTPSPAQAEVAIQRSKGSSVVSPLATQRINRSTRGTLDNMGTTSRNHETAIDVNIVILVNDNGVITQEHTKARVLVQHPLASPNTVVLGIATQSDGGLSN